MIYIEIKNEWYLVTKQNQIFNKRNTVSPRRNTPKLSITLSGKSTKYTALSNRQPRKTFPQIDKLQFTVFESAERTMHSRWHVFFETRVFIV